MKYEQYISYATWRRKPFVVQEHLYGSHTRKKQHKVRTPKNQIFAPSLASIYGTPLVQSKNRKVSKRPKSAAAVKYDKTYVGIRPQTAKANSTREQQAQQTSSYKEFSTQELTTPRSDTSVLISSSEQESYRFEAVDLGLLGSSKEGIRSAKGTTRNTGRTQKARPKSASVVTASSSNQRSNHDYSSFRPKSAFVRPNATQQNENAQCPSCMSSLPIHQLRSHCENECPCRLLSCPYLGCEMTYEAQEEKDHRLYYCVRSRKAHALCKRAAAKRTNSTKENWNCPACNSSKVPSIPSKIEEHKLLHCPYRIVKCKRCGLVMQAWQRPFHLGRKPRGGKTSVEDSDANVNEDTTKQLSINQANSASQKVPVIRLCKEVAIKRQAKQLRQKAMKATVKCENAGCNEVVLRLFLREHETKLCPKRLVRCPHNSSGCTVLIAAEELDEHLRNGCLVVQSRDEKARKGRQTMLTRSFTCTNDGCSENFATRTEMQLHASRVCEHREQICPNSSQGCKWKGKLKDLAHHIGSSCSVTTKCNQLAKLARAKREQMEMDERYICPLKCSVTFEKSSHGLALRNRHVETQCANRDVQCRYHEHGCNARLKARGQKEHEQNVCRIARTNRELLDRGLAQKEPSLCTLGCGLVLRNSASHTQIMHQEYECPCRLVKCSYCRLMVEQRSCNPPEKHQCRYFRKRERDIMRARMRLISKHAKSGKMRGLGATKGH